MKISVIALAFLSAVVAAQEVKAAANAVAVR
jgi:hypothetical protein